MKKIIELYLIYENNITISGYIDDYVEDNILNIKYINKDNYECWTCIPIRGVKRYEIKTVN
jgi:hypothetical protein